MRERLAWLGVAVATALGAWLRTRALGHAWEPDEVSTLFHGATVLRLVLDPETAVNPPLWRILFDVPFPETVAIRAGRGVAFVAGVAAIPVAARLAQRLTGSTVAMVAAALLVAVHPGSVILSARFRAYTMTALTLGAHLLAVDAWSRARTRRAEVAVVGTALLLPQWTYLGAPILLGVAAAGLRDPALTGLWRRYVPAALALLPVVPALLGDTSTRVPHPEPIGTTLAKLAAFHVGPEWRWVAPWRGAFRTVGEFTPAAVVAGAAWIAAQRGPGTPLRRASTGAVVGLVVAVAAASRVQLVRSAVAVDLVVVGVPLALAAVASLERARPLAALVLAGLLGWSFPPQADRSAATSVYEAVPRFVGRWRTWDDARDGRPIVLWPAWTWVAAWFELTGEHVLSIDGRGASVGIDGFVFDGVTWVRVREGERDARPVGLFVTVLAEPPAAWVEGCSRLEDDGELRVWSCPPR